MSNRTVISSLIIFDFALLVIFTMVASLSI